MQTFVNKIAL